MDSAKSYEKEIKEESISTSTKGQNDIQDQIKLKEGTVPIAQKLQRIASITCHAKYVSWTPIYIPSADDDITIGEEEQEVDLFPCFFLT